MPVFEYRGLDRGGKNVRGSVDAENVRTARLKLKREGVYVVDLKDKSRAGNKAKKSGFTSSGSVSVEDLSLMTRQLSTLLKSNIPLVDSLGAVAEQVENETLASALTDIKNSVNEGSSLHKALARYPKVFTNIFISMCEAGEMTGTLDVILERLAEFTESQNELNSKIKSASLYPILMILFTTAMLIGLFTFVIPKITSIFEQADMKLPWYTEVVIAISQILTDYWMILGMSAGLLFLLFRSWKATPNGRAQYDQIILKLPVIGKMARMIAVSRFTRTLSTLLAGGVPVLNALDIVENVVDNTVLRKAITAARENISEGESIAGPLKKSGEFPPIVIHMINIGEKTGELEFMLTQVSDSYDFQVKNNVQGLTSLLEPVMLVAMGIVIGVIVFAIMIPIFEMSNFAA